MNKLFIRLFVAFVAFSFGLVLTNFIKPVRRSDRVVTMRVPAPTFTASEDEAQIREIYREYGPAQMRHDRQFFERIETEDFTLTVGSLKLSREEDIKWMEEQPFGSAYESKVDFVNVFDRMALAHGHLEARSADLIRSWQFVDVWVKRGNVWQIQSTTSL